MRQLRSWNKQGERENDPRQKIARMQPGKKETKHNAISRKALMRERERERERESSTMIPERERERANSQSKENAASVQTSDL
jgi:hypothetical protein